MTAASPLPFPGSGALAAWRRQLGDFQSHSMWVSHLLVHRVEALVLAHRSTPLDPLTGPVLKALGIRLATDLGSLEECLCLGVPVLRRLLDTLRLASLVVETDGQWNLTDNGREALATGLLVRRQEERRTFHFLASGHAEASFHFLPRQLMPSRRGHGRADTPFEVATLDACLRQSPEWKRQQGFPLDVCEIVRGGKDATAFWKSVILDRPEFCSALLLVNGKEVLGFAANPQGWTLVSPEPAFTIRSDWQQVFPDLTADPPLDAWRLAWQAWCQSRSLPAADVAACSLSRVGNRLRATVSRKRLEGLRPAVRDAMRGETWLLAGEGGTRAAAQLEISEG